MIYGERVKVEDVLKEIKQKDDKEIQKMEVKPVDKYDIDKILSKGKDEREKKERE